MSAKLAAWLLSFLAIASAGFPQANAHVRQLDRAAADQYLAQARRAAASGAWAEVGPLLDGSLEFFPEYSESCLLYARLRLREQEGTRAGLEWLRRALASGTWTVSDPAQATTELAAVLVRTRRFAEARSTLAALGPRPGLGARDNPEAALLWGQALLGLGEAAAASRHLELAVDRYPQKPRLYLELARARLAFGQGAAAREVLNRGRRALPGAAQLTLEAARLQREPPRRRELLEEYARQGGTNPAAAALALSLGPRDPAAWQERFLSWGGPATVQPLAELQAFYRALPPTLLAAVQGFSGYRTLDADGDGFYEERYQFQQGSLQSWVLDRDQDGVPEAEVQFDSGLPRSASFQRPVSLVAAPRRELPAAGLEFRYSSYPFLAEVTARDGRGRRVYELEPYRERLALFAGSPPFGSAPLRLATSRWPTEAEVARLAFAMRETPAGGQERRYTLQAGQVVRLEEAPYDEGKYGRVVEYSQGRPVKGRRDLDQDGVFEVRESYEGGQLAGLSEDSDGDGRPEFWEQFTPQGSRRFWDYDGDGRADSREQQSAGGLLLEFSSRRDGVFDAAALFRGGRLVEFRRGGRTLPVSPSSSAGIFWLGRPAGRPERFQGLPDGLHLLEGASYFVFTYGPSRYVEQLQL
jgi:tetratricopeptide (TPR) repeat protein